MVSALGGLKPLRWFRVMPYWAVSRLSGYQPLIGITIDFAGFYCWRSFGVDWELIARWNCIWNCHWCDIMVLNTSMLRDYLGGHAVTGWLHLLGPFFNCWQRSDMLRCCSIAKGDPNHLVTFLNDDLHGTFPWICCLPPSLPKHHPFWCGVLTTGWSTMAVQGSAQSLIVIYSSKGSSSPFAAFKFSTKSQTLGMRSECHLMGSSFFIIHYGCRISSAFSKHKNLRRISPMPTPSILSCCGLGKCLGQLRIGIDALLVIHFWQHHLQDSPMPMSLYPRTLPVGIGGTGSASIFKLLKELFKFLWAEFCCRIKNNQARSAGPLKPSLQECLCGTSGWPGNRSYSRMV